MFDNLKLPRWLGWAAFVVAFLYFLVKVGLSIWRVVDPISNPHLEPAIEIIDVVIGILTFIAAAGLHKDGEFKRVFGILRQEILKNRRVITQGFQKLSKQGTEQHQESTRKIENLGKTLSKFGDEIGNLKDVAREGFDGNQTLIKEWIVSSGNEPTKKTGLSEVDLRVLRDLWEYLKYEKIHELLQGYADNSVDGDLISNYDIYVEYRRHPKYELDDLEIEGKLKELDIALDDTLNRGSILFSPAKSRHDHYKWNDFDYPLSQAEYAARKMQFESFVQEKVIPTRRVYQEFLDILKRRHIFQLLEWSEDENDVQTR